MLYLENKGTCKDLGTVISMLTNRNSFFKGKNEGNEKGKFKLCQKAYRLSDYIVLFLFFKFLLFL